MTIPERNDRPRWSVMRPLYCSLLLMSLSACAAETVINQVDEFEANQIYALLRSHDIASTKVMDDSGRTVMYNIMVPAGDAYDAYVILNKNNYPRPKITKRGDVFADSGLIPTSGQEKAKSLMALEGEIQAQLMLIAGMLDVQVNLNIPEQSALDVGGPPPPASASVVYRAQASEIDVSDDEIAALVAASVSHLSASRVQVAGSRLGGGGAPSVATTQPAVAGILARFSTRTQKSLLAGVVLVFMVMAVLIFYLSVSLRGVRGRFQRLQEEILRARQKVVTPENLPT